MVFNGPGPSRGLACIVHLDHAPTTGRINWACNFDVAAKRQGLAAFDPKKGSYRGMSGTSSHAFARDLPGTYGPGGLPFVHSAAQFPEIAASADERMEIVTARLDVSPAEVRVAAAISFRRRAAARGAVCLRAA